MVTAVHVEPRSTGARLVVDVSEGVPYNVFTLASPYRLVVDLPEVRWNLSGAESLGEGLVSRLRVGRFKPGTFRVVFDVSRPVRILHNAAIQRERGHQIVVDIEPVPAGSFKPMSIGAVHPAAPVGGSVATATRPVKKPTIAIDAGHGGEDPGAIGVGGTYEKHVTLVAARELRARLEATGRYRVVLTRDRDVFLRLRDRVLRARKAGADLFISLHADSIGSPDVRGLSVYTLSDQASDREAAALAARENKADLIGGVDLRGVAAPEVINILIDLAQRETMNLSAHYARTLVADLGDQTFLLPETHRSAGFAVLKAPDVPSVLIELGYLSNPHEERALLQSAYRSRLIDGIVRATDRFFAYRESLGRSSTQARFGASASYLTLVDPRYGLIGHPAGL